MDAQQATAIAHRVGVHHIEQLCPCGEQAACKREPLHVTGGKVGDYHRDDFVRQVLHDCV